MTIEAIDYAIDRGLTDAEWLYRGEADLQPTREFWENEVTAIMEDGRRSLRPFCAHIDELAETAPDDIGTERKLWFLRPVDLIERTRGAIEIINVLADIKKGKLAIDPGNMEAVAEAAKLGGTEELRNIVDQLFVVREGAWEYFLDMCGVGDGFEIDLELTDWANIDETILESLACNSLPEGRGSKKLIRNVRASMLEDLKKAVERFVDEGWSTNVCVLNQYSYYFRTFGFPAYLLWFDYDNGAIAKSVSDRPQVQQELRRIFSPGGKWNAKELKPNWRRRDHDIPETVRNMIAEGAGKEEIYQAVCASYGFPYSKDQMWNRLNVNQVIAIIEFYERHDIPIAPFPSYFFNSRGSITARLEKLGASLEFCDFLGVPAKVRAFIVHDSTAVEELQVRAHMFEQHGLKPEYYAPYMHYDIWKVPFLLHQIIAVVCAERQSESAKQHPRSRKKLKRLTSHASPSRVAGNLYLNRHGMPHETIHNQEISPESVACKVRLCVEAGIAIPTPNIINKFTFEGLKSKIPALRVGAKRNLRDIDYDEGEFERVLGERNIELPQYMIDMPQRFHKVRVVQLIREIETYGIPFTAESMEHGLVHWSWINMAAHERIRKMYRSWARIHDEERRTALCAQYGLTPADLPLGITSVRMTTDGLWRRLILAKEAGLTREDFSLSKIHMLSKERFRGYLHDLLADREDKRTLSMKNSLYMRKFMLAEYVEKDLGWKEPARLFDGMSDDEFDRIEHLIRSGLEIPAIKSRLEENHRVREECVTQMLYRHYSHEEIEEIIATHDLPTVRHMLQE